MIGKPYPKLPKAKLISSFSSAYSSVTCYGAIEAYRKIEELYSSYQGNPPKEITDGWKPLIDGAAVLGMGDILEKINYKTISVGSEGAKELFVVGEEAPSVKGIFGKGEKIVETVSDAVEGTTPASQRKPGATSVIAAVAKPEKGFGIRKTPPNTHYLLKFIAGPKANGVISLKNSFRENFKNYAKALKLSPKKIILVTMDPDLKSGRETNIETIEDALSVGLTVYKINVGDLMPSIRAVMDPVRFKCRPVIVATRGGYEEGIMAGAAAKALGGFMQAREFNQDNITMGNNPILELDKDIVPAASSDIAMSVTFITPDVLWFGQPGIRQDKHKYICTSLIIDHNGLSLSKQSIKI